MLQIFKKRSFIILVLIMVLPYMTPLYRVISGNPIPIANNIKHRVNAQITGAHLLKRKIF